MSRYAFASLFVLLTCSYSTAAPAPAPASKLDLVEGSWKITRLISLGSAHTLTKVPASTECLTKDKPAPAAATGWPDGATCDAKAVVDGKTVNWTFTCTQGATTITGSGPLAFTGKKMSATIKIEKVTTDDGGMSGQRGLLKITGAYVGACKP
jgi:hypothetical protein